MRDFLVSIGSNRRISAGMLLAEFKIPWDFLAETNAEGRSPEATSSTNLKWWTYGESHPGLVHAMDACYCYTIGPLMKVIFFDFWLIV